MAGAGFDAATYKETTRAQWQDAADAWHRWDPVFDRWLGEGTSLLLDRAAVTEGSRVLDVAAGSGGQTIEAARRVGASGAVLATDIASNILDHAGAVAHAAGLANVATRVDGRREPRGRSRVVRRRDLAPRADVPARQGRARSRARARRSVPAAGTRRSSSPSPSGTASSRCRSRSSARGPSCRRRLRGCPARSRQSAWATCSSEAGFTDVAVHAPRGPAAPRERGRVRTARARVVRGAPPDARRPRRGRAGGDLGRDRAGTRRVRGAGRLRRAVRAARRRRDALGKA